MYLFKLHSLDKYLFYTVPDRNIVGERRGVGVLKFLNCLKGLNEQSKEAWKEFLDVFLAIYVSAQDFQKVYHKYHKVCETDSYNERWCLTYGCTPYCNVN